MRKTTKLCALLLAVLLLFSAALPAAATPREISVLLHGEPLTFDVAPRIVNNRTMVPVRAVFEALGAEVVWHGQTETVTADTADGDTITLTIGSRALYVNETAVEMDIAPFVTGGRTLAPVRFIAEALGAQVTWVEDSQAVYITR